MAASDDSAVERITESDGSHCMTEYLLTNHTAVTNASIVICFHGSGVDHTKTWKDLLDNLSQIYRTVYFDRGLRNPSPQEHVKVLWSYLTSHGLHGPYILVAHSYGGLFAKHFVSLHHGSVGGMVLAETGKGGTTDLVQSILIRKRRLGSKPLSVIHGNSFLQQRHAIEVYLSDEIRGRDPKLHSRREEWLKRCEEEDEKLEKGQLKLSNNSRYVHLPECGHNVVRDSPDVVLQEVQWAVDQHDTQRTSHSWFDRTLRFLSI